MDQRAQERQDTLRQLIKSDSLTLDQARAALLDLLDVSAVAQTGPDVTAYHGGGSFSFSHEEVVDAEYAAREDVGNDVDGRMLDALQPSVS
ncbi:hypothetical protein ABR737_01575 [Streptomyces sp. Edi2]|uniref:hypothetical protein n=1 Tax=Streptomyces sp. Edi2 TaxID=3162528 RepID=UPI0033064DD6